ncbi:hypothetical protein ACOSQ3_017677 [Xanthoceras sorbifolium]
MAASRSSSYGNNNIDSFVINRVKSSSFPSHLNFNLPLKRDQENYVLWKSQVLLAISAYDLEDFILGESTSPSKFVKTRNEESGEFTQTVNIDFLQWKKTDQLLVCWLRSILSPTVIGQIRSQIQGTKKGSMTIIEYVLKLRTLVDSLAASGYLMSERDLLFSVLQGLGNEYDACIVTITALQSTITVQDTQFLLMSYEARLDQQTSSVIIDLIRISKLSVVDQSTVNNFAASCNTFNLCTASCKCSLLCKKFVNITKAVDYIHAYLFATLPSSTSAMPSINSATEIALWHRKLGHPSSQALLTSQILFSFFKMYFHWLLFSSQKNSIDCPSLPVSLLSPESCAFKNQQFKPSNISALSSSTPLSSNQPFALSLPIDPSAAPDNFIPAIPFGTTEKCLCFKRVELEMQGFMEVDFDDQMDYKRTTTWSVFSLDITTVCWVSQLQKITVLSTIEAQYLDVTEASKK